MLSPLQTQHFFITHTTNVGTLGLSVRNKQSESIVGTFGSSVRTSKASQNRHAVSVPTPMGSHEVVTAA